MGRPIFDDFRSGMGGEACRQLGIDPTRSHDWASLRETAAMLDPGELSRAANRLAYVVPSAEYMVLLATLSALGFAFLADELNHEGTWGLLDVCDQKARLAIAAAVARFD